MAESEAIKCVVTDGNGSYSLRLAVTLETKTRVITRDVANPIIEGTAQKIKWAQVMHKRWCPQQSKRTVAMPVWTE